MKRGLYFGAMFSKCTLCVTVFFQVPSSILVSVTFTEVLTKDLARMLIHVRKIGYLSKFCWQCASYLLRRDFEPSCAQVENAIFEKDDHNRDGSRSHLGALSYRWF